MLRPDEILQAVFAEIDETGFRWQVISNQVGSDYREKNLSAVRNRHEASGTIERLSIIITRPDFRFARMQSCPDLDMESMERLLETTLRGKRRTHSICA